MEGGNLAVARTTSGMPICRDCLRRYDLIPGRGYAFGGPRCAFCGDEPATRDGLPRSLSDGREIRPKAVLR